MPVDFGLLDPSAFYKGAANTNAMMQRVAQRKAGEHLSKGDTKGAMDTLNQSGDLEGARNVQLQLDEKDERLNKMSKEHRARQTEMVLDVAGALKKVQAEHGDAAILPAFQQLLPMLKANDATDQDLQPFVEGFSKDPGGFLDRVLSVAQQHAKEYTLGQGDVRMRGDEQLGNNPKPVQPQYRVIPAGASLAALPSAENPQATSVDIALPPEAVSHLQPGHVTKFRNGQSWTMGANGPERVE